MTERTRPRLWSDCDGTALALAGRYDPRRMSKYPLKMVPGYRDFLDGVTASGEVDIAGIITRRPNIWQRNAVTRLSVGRLGLRHYFPENDQIILTGSEVKKAQHLIGESNGTVVGIIDDRPHMIGLELVRGLLKSTPPRPGSKRSLVLGVVNHERTQEYMDMFRFVMESGFSDNQSHELSWSKQSDGAFVVSSPSPDNYRFQVTAVQLDPYSYSAGQEFSQRLVIEQCLLDGINQPRETF